MGTVKSEREEKLLEDVKILLGGTITYSDESITKISPNRDAEGYITSIDYYADDKKKFTLTITRDANKRIIDIVRS